MTKSRSALAAWACVVAALGVIGVVLLMAVCIAGAVVVGIN